MLSREKIIEMLQDLEKATEAFNIPPFDIYLMGGSACLLAGYHDRGTRDFDLVDLHYAPGIAKVLVFLREYDLLEYESVALPSSYRERAARQEGFDYLNIYVLSKEDVIVSKIIRMDQRDKEDLDAMVPKADKAMLNQLIDEVLGRDDLFEMKKIGFRKGLKQFRERYYV